MLSRGFGSSRKIKVAFSFDSVVTEKCTKELREGLGLVKRISRSGGSV